MWSVTSACIMKTIEEIIDRSRPVGEIISDLSQKSTEPFDWSKFKYGYYPYLHKIHDDRIGRRDKVHENGQIDEAARLVIPYEMLFINHLVQFMFANSVKREYMGIDGNEIRQKIANSIERIYENVDIDSVNMDRGLAYFASGEILTIWYAVKKENDVYGFHSQYKLKCKVFSPMTDDCDIYPLMDEDDDMIAVSVKYSKKVKDETINYFETFTNTKHYKWHSGDGDDWTDDIKYTDSDGNISYGDDIVLGKIPGLYAYRKKPAVIEGTKELREDDEYLASRDSDIVAYNAAPILEIKGQLKGDEKKGETRRIYKVSESGGINYVAWNGATEATKNHHEMNKSLLHMINQMPDISFESLKSLGNIGYDARMMIFQDIILKVKMESKPLIQMFRREGNVIKAFLKLLNTQWAKEVDNVWIKHSIDIYIPKDESSEIDKRMKANGGKPIESQLESIQRFGRSKDPQATLEAIKKEQEESLGNTINSLLNKEQEKE